MGASEEAHQQFWQDSYLIRKGKILLEKEQNQYSYSLINNKGVTIYEKHCALRARDMVFSTITQDTTNCECY